MFAGSMMVQANRDYSGLAADLIREYVARQRGDLSVHLFHRGEPAPVEPAYTELIVEDGFVTFTDALFGEFNAQFDEARVMHGDRVLHQIIFKHWQGVVGPKVHEFVLEIPAIADLDPTATGLAVKRARQDDDLAYVLATRELLHDTLVPVRDPDGMLVGFADTVERVREMHAAGVKEMHAAELRRELRTAESV